MVAPNTIENPTQPGGTGAQVVPATLVVANTREDFPLTETGISDAITQLNASGGGLIYLGQDDGVPVPISAALPIITAPMKIIGPGRRALTLVPAAGVTLFRVAGVTLTLSDFSVTGDEDTAQKFLELTAGVTDQTLRITVERVTIGNSVGVNVGRIKTVFDCGGFSRTLVVTDCVFNVRSSSDSAGSRLITNAANASFFMDNVIGFFGCGVDSCGLLNAKGTSIFSSSSGIVITTAFLANSSLLATGQTIVISGQVTAANSGFSANTTTIGASSRITTSGMGRVIVAGSDVKIAHSIISLSSGPVAVEVSGFDRLVLRDNSLSTPVGGANVLIDDATGCVIEDNSECQVTESGTSDFNRFTKILNTSVIVGPSSRVEGSLKFGVTGEATTGAFVTQFTRENPKGLLGIGTIKNTGAAPLEVRQTVTDAFGVSSSATQVVAGGNDFLLTPQVNFGTARPPYVSYAVDVQDQGVATTFDLQFTVQEAM